MSACCPTDKVQAPPSGYQGKGAFTTIAGLKCYTVGSGSNGAGVRLIDCCWQLGALCMLVSSCLSMISSDSTATTTKRQTVCLKDGVLPLLGLDGALVVVPDFFDGKPWPASKYPPNTPELQKEFGEWIQGVAAPARHVETARAVANYMIKERGVTKLGTIGHCWGGKVGALMGTNPPELCDHSGPHPTFLNKEDGLNAKLPALYLETKDDNLADFEAGVRESGAKNITVKKYKETFHGFMAGRGDWSDPEQKKVSDKAIAELIAFHRQWLL